MTIDKESLKALAEAFPSDLDWDSNTEPFFNGPSGESLGGGSTGFYCVYGAPFKIEGDDYEYDGPTYVEACSADFAKFMTSAREGVLTLLAEIDRMQLDAKNDAIAYKAAIERQDEIRAERDALRKDLESHKRMLLSAAVSIGTIGEALGSEMDDDPSELEGLAAELRKDAEFHQQVQRAAVELPHGWQILIRIEKDAGNAELIDSEGNEVDYPSNHECLADSVSDAIDEALSAEKTGD